MSGFGAALPAEAAAGLSTRWQVYKKHEGTYTDSAAKVRRRTHARAWQEVRASRDQTATSTEAARQRQPADKEHTRNDA